MPALNQILTLERTACHVACVSKKRLFETITDIICSDQHTLSHDAVLDQLIAREKLGSTGLGQGIAIPHCRVDECSQPIGTLVTLEKPIAFDAPDDQPVDLLFVLLVPGEAHQQHLDILAEIARLFNQQEFCQRLRAAQDNQSLFNIANGGTG